MIFLLFDASVLGARVSNNKIVRRRKMDGYYTCVCVCLFLLTYDVPVIGCTFRFRRLRW